MTKGRIITLCALGLGVTAVLLLLTTDRGASMRNAIADASDDLLQRARDQSAKAMDGIKDVRDRAKGLVS